MKEEIKVPSLGESISEAVIAAILKPAGSLVRMDDEVIELATDKVNQVIYAPKAGIFTPTVKEEDVVVMGQTIGCLSDGSQAQKEQPEQKQEVQKEQPEQKPEPEIAPITAKESSSSENKSDQAISIKEKSNEQTTE